MTEEHGNFERLVVGHVLGDLPDADASRFRSHLLGCRECRARVAELRGIAADLADAERDELARARVRTETPRRVEHPEEPHLAGGQRITIRHVTMAALVVVALAAAMAFWNLHLRASSAVYQEVAQDRGATLEGLANGVPLEVELAAGVSGIAAADGERVALTLTGVEPPADGELLVAWFLGSDEGPSAEPLARPGQVEDGAISVTLDDPGATQLLVTRETDPGDRPDGETLLRATLLGS